MNKESIYKIIGYHGEYNENVKKSIKKLLKENHPDHNGDVKIFKLINEVKKELETNNVSYKFNNSKKEFNDIDYDFCKKMISKLEKDLININDLIKKEKEKINIIDHKYNGLYQDSLNNRDILLSLEEKKNNLKRIKTKSLITSIVLLILFIFAVLKRNIYLFIAFILISITLFIEIMKFFDIINKIASDSELKIKKYFHIASKIDNNKKIREGYVEKMLELNTKKVEIENDLRFYKRMIS